MVFYFKSNFVSGIFFWNSASPTARTSSTIKIWFAILPVRKALRACLRQPISARPAPRFRLQMRCDREPHIHSGAIQVDSLVPTHLIRRVSHPAPPSELPRGSLPSGRPAAWVTGVSIYRAHPENSTISSNFRAIWFALFPSRKALRACLRHPSSTLPIVSVRPSASPKSPRSGKYFDLRLPSGAAPFGPTFGCSSYGLPSPPVHDLVNIRM